MTSGRRISGANVARPLTVEFTTTASGQENGMAGKERRTYEVESELRASIPRFAGKCPGENRGRAGKVFICERRIGGVLHSPSTRMKRHSRSSGFPARDPQPQCHASGVFFEPQRTQRPQRQDNGREAAAFVCAVRVVVGLQGDLPPHPRPLSPVPGARGGFCVFELHWKARMAPLAPGRGEGPGVRGEVPLEAAVQSHG